MSLCPFGRFSTESHQLHRHHSSPGDWLLSKCPPRPLIELQTAPSASWLCLLLRIAVGSDLGGFCRLVGDHQDVVLLAAGLGQEESVTERETRASRRQVLVLLQTVMLDVFTFAQTRRTPYHARYSYYTPVSQLIPMLWPYQRKRTPLAKMKRWTGLPRPKVSHRGETRREVQSNFSKPSRFSGRFPSLPISAACPNRR